MKALNPNLRCNFYSPATFYFSLLRLLFHSALRLPPMKIRWKHWWPIFATGDNSMLVTIQYWWQFRCWWQFQYWWQFNIGDPISFLAFAHHGQFLVACLVTAFSGSPTPILSNVTKRWKYGNQALLELWPYGPLLHSLWKCKWLWEKRWKCGNQAQLELSLKEVCFLNGPLLHSLWNKNGKKLPKKNLWWQKKRWK